MQRICAAFFDSGDKREAQRGSVRHVVAHAGDQQWEHGRLEVASYQADGQPNPQRSSHGLHRPAGIDRYFQALAVAVPSHRKTARPDCIQAALGVECG